MGERYYVLEKFAAINSNLVRIIEALPIKRQAVDIYRQKNKLERAKETYNDLEELKVRLLNNIKDLSLLFPEVEMDSAAELANKLYAAVVSFNLMTADYTKLISAITVLNEQIPKSEAVTAKVIANLMNNVKMGYYPTDLNHVKMIRESLKFPDIRVNLFDPCCGEGLALELLGEDKNCMTFGTEIDESRGKEAETRLDRVGFGSFYHSIIKNHVFHVLFLNPPYLNIMGESGINTRSEKRFLVEGMQTLMIGGILIYIIPYYRLTYDICRVICDNFENISIYRFLDKEFAAHRQIVVMGVRKQREDGGKQAEILSQYAMMPEKIPYIDALKSESYEVPNVEKEVDLFKGANFNLGELQRQMSGVKFLSTHFEKNRIDAMQKRPLLPLSIGQVGLIGGSGLINGYVDCDNPHIIKGRIVKEIHRYVDKDLGTETELRVNKMIFNILTPDGVKRLV